MTQKIRIILKNTVGINEEKAFKIIAKSLLAYSDLEIDKLIKEGALVEIERGTRNKENANQRKS